MSLTLGGRLKQLSGLSGATVGAMLVAIGTGTTMAQCLPSYSGLASGTVGDHLRVDRAMGNDWLIRARRRSRR